LFVPLSVRFITKLPNRFLLNLVLEIFSRSCRASLIAVYQSLHLMLRLGFVGSLKCGYLYQRLVQYVKRNVDLAEIAFYFEYTKI
jgi:hypothetical protein